MTDTSSLFGTGPRVPSVAFEDIGDTVSGVVLEKEVLDDIDMNTKLPRKDKNGRVMKVVVLTLQTDNVSNDDDGKRKLYVRSFMFNAIREALESSGSGDLVEGGTLAVTFTERRKIPNSAYKSKHFKAEYTPPSDDAVSLLREQGLL